MQEDLHDRKAVVHEGPFPVIDLTETSLPELPGRGLGRQVLARKELGVDAHHQNFFVVGPVEDADLPATGEVQSGAPEELVRQFLG